MASGPFRVPDRARLDFAIGTLEPAWQAGPVDFEVASCEGTLGEDTGDEGAAGQGCVTLFREQLDPEEESGRGFRERSLGLQDLAGRRLALRFTARAAGSPDSRSLPVFADPVLLAPAERSAVGDDSGHNLILLSLDTLRADHMGEISIIGSWRLRATT